MSTESSSEPKERELLVKPSEASSSSSAPRVKPPPSKDAIPVPFDYAPSDDGTDENLLILLHGLGMFFVLASRVGLEIYGGLCR